MVINHRKGNFIIGTETPAIMQNKQTRFLSVVLRHGILWDFAVTESEEDALSMHDSFCFAAELLDPILTAKEQEENGKINRAIMN